MKLKPDPNLNPPRALVGDWGQGREHLGDKTSPLRALAGKWGWGCEHLGDAEAKVQD